MIIIGGMQEHQAVKKDGICTCLTSSMGTGGGYIPMITIKGDINMSKHYAIRKLTPTECFRLQGMNDKDVEKARALGVSDSQLYKIARNGLTTTCVQFIAEHTYKAVVDSNYETTDERMIKSGYGV